MHCNEEALAVSGAEGKKQAVARFEQEAQWMRCYEEAGLGTSLDEPPGILSRWSEAHKQLSALVHLREKVAMWRICSHYAMNRKQVVQIFLNFLWLLT